MLEIITESKNITQLLQEIKKHILVPDSILTDLNQISKLTGVDQQRISVEIFKAGLKRTAKKYHLINEQSN